MLSLVCIGLALLLMQELAMSSTTIIENNGNGDVSAFEHLSGSESISHALSK